MADDHQFQASGNWWDSASRNVRFESGASQSSSSNLTNLGSFAWNHPADMEDMKPSSSMSLSNATSVVFHDTHNHKLQLQPSDHNSPSSTDPNNFNIIMGLGLSSSQPLDWNQASNLLRGEKGSDSRLRWMFQENLSSGSSNFQEEGGMGLPQAQWREKLLFSAESSNTNDQFKQVNRNFCLDHHQTTHQFSPQYSSGDSTVTTSQGLASSNFHMDSSTPSILQGLLGPEANSSSSSFDINNSNRSVTMSFPYGSMNSNSNDQLMGCWPKVPQFLRASSPKQPQNCNTQLHFTNNAPFWNANSDAHPAIKDARPTFFPSLQPPFPAPNFDAQSKNICGGRDSGSVGKKSGSEGAPKRPRNEASSPLPAFKVRKEKMGDRITALQQLVSPFGKTDTASVLSEAIEYIKFLHEQVTVLSTPYMKSGAPIQHQQSSGKSKEPEALKQDLRSRGLCLVPVSSTFPVTHETTVDFWMPTFGATFR